MTERRSALSVRGVEFPTALLGLARLVFVGLLLALGASILRHSLGDLSAEADPALSIAIDFDSSERPRRRFRTPDGRLQDH